MVVTGVIEAVAIDNITSPGSAITVVPLLTNTAIRLFVFSCRGQGETGGQGDKGRLHGTDNYSDRVMEGM